MAGPAKVVEQYFDAWTSKDFERARSLLDDDLSFTGPFERLESADALMGSIQGVAQIVTGAGRRPRRDERLLGPGRQRAVTA